MNGGITETDKEQVALYWKMYPKKQNNKNCLED